MPSVATVLDLKHELRMCGGITRTAGSKSLKDNLTCHYSTYDGIFVRFSQSAEVNRKTTRQPTTTIKIIETNQKRRESIKLLDRK